MRNILYLLSLLIIAFSCSKEIVNDRIDLCSPVPKEAITRMSLSEAQKEYINTGNTFAFKCLKDLSEKTTGSLIFSPLSLQYALAMAANGASGETREEIVNSLGYGKEIDELNTFCNKLLNELPALDLDVDLILSDAVIISDKYKVKGAYERILNGTFYAPVEYLDAKDKQKTVDRINDWASRNTKGVISPFISADEISDNFAAIILNALYFKSKWCKLGNAEMFLPENTLKNHPFYLLDGGNSKVDYMPKKCSTIPYCAQNGYRVLGIPYSKEKFYFYVLLPDEVDGLQNMIADLSKSSWSDINAKFSYSTMVDFRIPKFEVESKHSLKETLTRLGIVKAFDPTLATFDELFETGSRGANFSIGSILQKAKITVEEEGTKAAAVTGIGVDEEGGVTEPPKEVVFYADHPFVFLIAEKTSGVILFEGVFTGR